MKLNPKMILVAVIFVALIVGYYWYLSNRLDNNAENKGDLTAVQKVTTANLEQDYPKTPREVLKAYNEIQTCFYNEEYSEEELQEMVAQARSLLDPQLLALSSLIPLPRGISSCFSPSPVNNKRPINRAHTMECPVISRKIMFAMNMINAITRLIRY